MKDIAIPLTEKEVELIIKGLEVYASDYCFRNDEELPYRDLIKKLREVQR